MKPGNILKIDSLDENWRDKDSVMLHACFQILKDCVEKEKLFDGHVNWDADEKHRLARSELQQLYNWWCSYSENNLPNEESLKIENDMLKRLVDVRWALWV